MKKMNEYIYNVMALALSCYTWIVEGIWFDVEYTLRLMRLDKWAGQPLQPEKFSVGLVTTTHYEKDWFGYEKEYCVEKTLADTVILPGLEKFMADIDAMAIKLPEWPVGKPFDPSDVARDQANILKQLLAVGDFDYVMDWLKQNLQ